MTGGGQMQSFVWRLWNPGGSEWLVLSGYLEGFSLKETMRLWISGRNDQKQTFTCKRVFEGAVIRRREKTGNWENSKQLKRITGKGKNVMLEKKWNNIAPEVPQIFIINLKIH